MNMNLAVFYNSYMNRVDQKLLKFEKLKNDYMKEEFKKVCKASDGYKEGIDMDSILPSDFRRYYED